MIASAITSADPARASARADPSLTLAHAAQFAPQFGGYCAWAVSRGYTADGDPDAWKIVDGRLYLNYSRAAAASEQPVRTRRDVVRFHLWSYPHFPLSVAIVIAGVALQRIVTAASRAALMSGEPRSSRAPSRPSCWRSP